MRLTGFILAALTSAAAGQPMVLQERTVHLRSGASPEWDQFGAIIPDGRELQLTFQGQANAGPATLLVAQDDVKLEWRVELNGHRLGSLFLMEAPLQQTFPVPPSTLQQGENKLIIRPPKENDDIRVGPIRLFPGPWPLDQTSLLLAVTDSDTGAGIPARFTILDATGALAALSPGPDQRLACRPGVVYTPDGRAKVHLLPGQYTVYATRGLEYGLDQRTLSLAAGTPGTVALSIRREVPTPGLISCDPHTHTFTYSRHGDATLEERVITLAGEGIELPIATDHNILTDYAPAARQIGVDQYFTPVIGDEVTTQKAHYNVFPITANSRVPNFLLPEWGALLESMRGTPGVQLIVLNHPHNIHHNFEPFTPERLQEILDHPDRPLGYDAIELVNSSALQSDMRQIFEDWFALLNAGHRLTGLGSSDVHDVSRYIVGQGRTYIRCPDDNPGRIDVDAACSALRDGRALVSMGLLVNLKVNGKSQPGDVVRAMDRPLEVEVTVLAPAWIEADRVELYSNGKRVREAALSPTGKGGEKARLTWTLPPPEGELFLVALATGPPVRGLYWAIPRPYQPRGPAWNPIVIGCTNPVWVSR